MCNSFKKDAKKVLKKEKKKNFFGAHLPHKIFLVLWGFQNMRKFVNKHYPLPIFFADQINI